MEYGKRTGYKVAGNKVEIFFEKQNAVIEVIKHDIINFFVPVWSTEHRSKAIEGEKAVETAFSVEEEPDALVITTDSLIIRVGNDFCVDIYNSDKEPLLCDYRGPVTEIQRLSEKAIALIEAEGHDASGMKEKSHKLVTRKCLDPDDCIYGLGDKTGFLNKRGYEYENWNSDNPQAHTEDFHALYKSIPFLMCKKKHGVYGVFFDNTFHSYMDIGKTSEAYFSYAADDGNLKMHVCVGEEERERDSGMEVGGS